MNRHEKIKRPGTTTSVSFIHFARPGNHSYSIVRRQADVLNVDTCYSQLHKLPHSLPKVGPTAPADGPKQGHRYSHTHLL